MMMVQRGVAPAIGWFATAAIAGASVLVAAGCGGGGYDPAASAPAAQPGASTSASLSEQRIGFLRARSEGDPLDTFSLNALAMEHIQRFRETGDVAELGRAAASLDQSLRINRADNYDAIAFSASLAVVQHDFERGVVLANEAIAEKPRVSFAYGVLGDAAVGLGRYEEAAAAYDTALVLEPSASAHSRRALLAQINGDLGVAMNEWQTALAFAESSDIPEHRAWLRAQRANTLVLIGDAATARDEYEASLAELPGYVHALAGLGRIAAGEGEFQVAADRYEEAIARVPLPEYVIALGDVYEARGDSERAKQQYDLIDVIARLYAANGVSIDLQLALFNADRGIDVEATRERSAELYAMHPSIQAADALAWASLAAGDIKGAVAAIEQALRTSTKEPSIMFHAGMIYAADGQHELAQQYLAAVVERRAAISPRHSAIAMDALTGLRATADAAGGAPR